MKQNKASENNITYSAVDIIDVMLHMRNDAQRNVLMRFFKTGKGEYGEGDQFLGLRVPETRSVVKEARLKLPLSEISVLLESEWHEVRLCGFLLLVEEMKAALPKRKEPKTFRAERRREIAEFYLSHAHRANNWDLVDLSCPKILGEWMMHPNVDGNLPKRDILYQLAESENLWLQRISIVSTWTLIRHNEYEPTLKLATQLLHHPHDLIHKAVGWMLREVGKQDINQLRKFLSNHAASMPRTTLRYAIEHMDSMERMKWMNYKNLQDET